MAGDPIVEGYASAILELAKAEGAVEEVEDELFRFARLLDQHGDLRMALTDTTAEPERRQRVINELLAGKASPATVSALTMVVGAGRARQLRDIVDTLVEKVAAEKSRAVAEVTSAVPLDQAQRERLSSALSGATGKQVELHVLVDPTILGGVVARVGDQVIDGCVRTRLRRLREQVGAVRAVEGPAA